MQRIKRLYIITLCIGLLFGLTGAVQAQIELSLPDIVGEPGDEQQIAISVSDVTDDEVMGYQFAIHFDEDVADITNVSHNGTITPNAPTVNYNLENSIFVIWAGAAPLEGEGTLLYLTVELVGEGNTPLEWQEVEFYAQDNGDQVDIDVNTTDGSVGVYTQPEAPQLESPEDGADSISIDTTLMWEEVYNAYTYNVQVSVDDDFSDIIIDEQGVENTSLDIEGLAHLTEHFWRVQSVNPVGTSGWSAEWSFTTIVDVPDAPDLVMPENEATGVPTTATLEWDASEFADTYHLQVATDEDFDNLIADADNLVETFYELTGLDYATNYYWRVNAGNVSGVGDWSDVWVFTTIVDVPDAPVLVAPEDESINVPITVTLEWDPGADSEVYHLQVATDDDFESLVVDADSVENTSYELSDLAHGTAYYWRVRGENVSGFSDWSDTWMFTTIVSLPDKIVLSSPEDEAVIGTDTVTFAWYRGEPEILNYELEIATDADFSTIHYSNDELTDTVYVFTGIDDDTEYWWRVRAHNEAGAGEFSDSRMFEVVITSIDDEFTDIPDQYALYQNYPNPFNPSTNIRFSIPERSQVRIELYNMLGQSVATLVDGELAAGDHKVVWNADNSRASSGTYIYRIEAVSIVDPGNKFIDIRSMVLIR